MRMSELLNEVWKKEEELLSERVTSTAFRKKTARVNPMTQKDIERMVKDRKYKGNTSALMKDVKKKFPDEYESDIVQDMMKKHAETNENLGEAKDIKILVKDVKDRNFLKDLMNKAKDEKVMVGSPTPADKKAGKYVFVGPKDKVNNVFNYAFDKSINRGNYAPATMMHEETGEIYEGFASDAQRRAAFAQGYKAKGKKDKKEGNAFGAALKAAREKGEKTFMVSGKKYNVEDFDINEDGHVDVASSVRQCKTIVEDATQMMSKLQGMNPEDSLPSWWTNKLAVASNNMNKMRDYLLVPTTEEKQEPIQWPSQPLDEVKLSPPMIAKIKKTFEPLRGKKIGPAVQDKLMKTMDKIDKDKQTLIDLYKAGIPFVSQLAVTRLISKHNMKGAEINKLKENVELNEEPYVNTNSEYLVLIDKDNKIVAEFEGKNPLKDAKDSVRSAHLPPLNIPKNEVPKMRIVRMNKSGRKDRGRQLGDKLGALTVGLDVKVGNIKLSEMAYKPGSFKDTKAQEKGAKALADLAKTGGLDKKDYQKARSLYVQASDPASRNKLKNFIFNLDTEPKEEIMNAIGLSDPETFLQMYPNAKRGQPLTTVSFAHRNMKSEEVEVDEGRMKDLSMKIDSIVAKMKKDKMMKSFADKFKKDAMKSMDIKKSLEKVLPDYVAGKDIAALVKEEVELDEEVEDILIQKGDVNKIAMQVSKNAKMLGLKSAHMGPHVRIKGAKKKVSDFLRTVIGRNSTGDATSTGMVTPMIDKMLNKSMKEELEEKYDLYHKDFSSAMQHAYDYAKKKMGITVDPKEIDSKVATGPKKPTEGKTNKYRLKGKGGNLQIQVYNKGGSKPFELNMYKEGTDPSVSLYANQITLNAIKEK